LENFTLIESSKYIEEQRREYSLYVMQNRAIPSVTDGLKAAGRRVLWTGRNGEKYKTATLAGATMPIHPHGEASGSINTLAAPYGNNIPLFKGYGAFGTMLDPTAYGAARYTSVAVSKFTEDVMFKDIEIVPMMPNYDDTLEEPVHFLPLVPTVLLNPSEGIAVGFATNILPRSLEDIISVQVAHLTGKKIAADLLPVFTPINSSAFMSDGNSYFFNGTYEEINATTIRITNLPYGLLHEKVVAKLDDLSDKGIVVDFVDRSKDKVNIEVKFKKGILSSQSEKDTLKQLGLTVKHNENLNVLDFTGQGVWSAEPVDLITKFTDWRLEWYVKRYERLRDLLKIDLQRYYDIRTAIQNNVGGAARKVQNRGELKDLLEAFGIVYVDYIADLPVYRFTEEERLKNEERIKETEAQLAEYEDLLSDPKKRVTVYVKELNEILTKYKKGQYA
jgi:DNA gyrase subunit A